MREQWRVYYGVLLIMLRRAGRYCLRYLGGFAKKIGRRLVTWGEDSGHRFSIELFHRCYLADAEFHVGMDIYRGPMYATFSTGEELIFKLNWIALKKEYWEWSGAFDFIIKNPGKPAELPSGDVWFMFEGGYAVLFIGKPRGRLEFNNSVETPRVYSYF